MIPSSAELKVDCRVPPGLGEREVREGLAEVLGEAAADEPATWRIEFTEQVVGNRSPVASPLMDAISAGSRSATRARGRAGGAPGLHRLAPLPRGVPGVRRVRLLPQRHQSLLETAPLIHGADERIDVRDLAFATELYTDLALRILG